MPRNGSPAQSGFEPRPQSARAGAVTAVALSVAMSIAAGSCSAPSEVPEPAATDTVPVAATGPEPADRSVGVVTTACGSAPAAVGSAVRLDDAIVLTAAHVVAGAHSVAVVEPENLPPDRDWPAFSPGALWRRAVAATVVGFDAGRDLALIRIEPSPADRPDFGRPEIGTASVGDAVDVHGAATSPIQGSVALRTTIVADEVRGRSRVERDGYRLDATTNRGDSGAGVWSTDGRLVGVVFAVSSNDGSRTWAVSGREIADFLEAVAVGPAPSYRCDETTSRLVAADR